MHRTFVYGWVVVAVTAVVVMVTAGVQSAPGAFNLSTTAEPGWSTASVRRPLAGTPLPGGSAEATSPAEATAA